MRLSELIPYLHEEFFISNLRSETKEQLLEELIEPLVIAEKLKNKHIILEALQRRETLGSTGIGKGVAIPHCRTLIVSELLIVIGISKNGIPFNATDNKEIKLFFLIIAPPVEKTNVYLPILGKVVEMARDSQKRKALLKAVNFHDFMEVIQKD